LLQVVSEFGGRTDIARVATSLQSDVDDLLPVVEVAEALGLVGIQDGDIVLTQTGRKLLTSPPGRRKLILRTAISGVEPFASIFRMMESEGEVSIEEIFDKIMEDKALSEQYSDRGQLHHFLLEWLLYTEVVKYDGDEKTFEIKGARKRG